MASRDRSVTIRSSQARRRRLPRRRPIRPRRRPSARPVPELLSVLFEPQEVPRSSTVRHDRVHVRAGTKGLGVAARDQSASFVSSRRRRALPHTRVSALSCRPSGSTLTRLGPARHVAMPQSGGRVRALAAAMVSSSPGSMVRAQMCIFRAIRVLVRRARAVQAAKRTNHCTDLQQAFVHQRKRSVASANPSASTTKPRLPNVVLPSVLRTLQPAKTLGTSKGISTRRNRRRRPTPRRAGPAASAAPRNRLADEGDVGRRDEGRQEARSRSRLTVSTIPSTQSRRRPASALGPPWPARSELPPRRRVAGDGAHVERVPGPGVDPPQPVEGP